MRLDLLGCAPCRRATSFPGESQYLTANLSLGRNEKSMHKEQIVVGKAYVNEDACVLREVVEELDRNSVRCSTFDLATGRLLPTRHSNWNRAQLARWADREATEPEVA